MRQTNGNNICEDKRYTSTIWDSLLCSWLDRSAKYDVNAYTHSFLIWTDLNFQQLFFISHLDLNNFGEDFIFKIIKFTFSILLSLCLDLMNRNPKRNITKASTTNRMLEKTNRFTFILIFICCLLPRTEIQTPCMYSPRFDNCWTNWKSKPSASTAATLKTRFHNIPRLTACHANLELLLVSTVYC